MAKLLNDNIDNSKRIKAFKNAPKPRKKILAPKGERSEFSAGNIILTIFLVIFIIAVARSLLGSAPMTFKGFLTSITEVPSIDISTQVIDFAIGGSWGAFDFLRVFINSFVMILNFSIFIIEMLINLLLVLTWALGYLFGF